MSTLEKVVIISESADGFAGLSAFAKTLSADVCALVIGSAPEAEAVTNWGATKVCHIPLGEELFDNAFDTVKSVIASEAPQAVLLKISKRTRLLAARLAASFEGALLSDALRVWVEDGAVYAENMVYGGSALRITKSLQEKTFVLVADSALSAAEPASGSARVEEVAWVGASCALKRTECRARTVEAVNLVAAKKVVSIGRGIEKEEDLALINELAATLGAEVGCTRPIAEGVCWLARERYIGVSGVMLKPDLFVALGLSGQIQHMVGANRAKTIIAINKDKNAPLFKDADYGIVADLYAVVPRLIEQLK